MVAAEHLKIIIYEEFLLIFQNKCYLGGIFLNNGVPFFKSDIHLSSEKQSDNVS